MAKEIRKEINGICDAKFLDVLKTIKPMVKEPIDNYLDKNVVNFVIFGFTKEEITPIKEKIEKICDYNFTYAFFVDKVYEDGKHYYFAGHIQVDKKCPVNELIAQFNKDKFNI